MIKIFKALGRLFVDDSIPVQKFHPLTCGGFVEIQAPISEKSVGFRPDSSTNMTQRCTSSVHVSLD